MFFCIPLLIAVIILPFLSLIFKFRSVDQSSNYYHKYPDINIFKSRLNQISFSFRDLEGYCKQNGVVGFFDFTPRVRNTAPCISLALAAQDMEQRLSVPIPTIVDLVALYLGAIQDSNSKCSADLNHFSPFPKLQLTITISMFV